MDPICIIFDVDGTLVDSQAHILTAMARAFAEADHPAPSPQRVLGIVGLSLPQAMARLAPTAPPETRARLEAAYRAAFAGLRREGASDALSPLFPGARDLIDELAAQDRVLLGIATGKSRCGLNHVLQMHRLEVAFATIQTADEHPSKPHPAMIEACLDETGVAADNAVLVGDSVYDMEMARAAGIAAIGVEWGYAAPADLIAAGATQMVGDFDALGALLRAEWARA